MIRRLAFFLLIFMSFVLGANSYAIHKSDLMGSVSVSSVYRDQATQKEVRVWGNGSLVRISDTAYVLTASHLTQGERVEVYLDGNPLSIGARLADSLLDVELLEVFGAPPKKILAWWSPRLQQFALTEGGLKSLDRLSQERKTVIAAADSTGTVILPIKLSPRNTLVLPQDAVYFLPFGVYASTHNGYAEFAGNIGVKPGMSGLPSISTQTFKYPNGEETKTIRGLVSRKVRNFERSYFVSSHSIHATVDRLINGSRGSVDGTRWLLSRGILYRDLGDGSLEVDPRSIQMGNGVSVDSGNGVSVDSGNGVSVDSGDNELSADASSISTGLSAGMIWQGQRVLGFLVTDPRSGVHTPLYGDLQSVEFIRRHPDFLVKPIFPGDSLIDIFNQALGGKPPAGSSSFPSPTSFSFGMDEVGSELHLSRSFQLEKERISILLTNSRHAWRGKEKPPEDALWDTGINLNSQGGIDNQAFRPHVSVKNKEGSEFVFDLKDLFFADLSRSDHFSPRLTYRKKDFPFGSSYPLRWTH